MCSDYLWDIETKTNTGASMVIDAENAGSIARFINHSTYPNLKTVSYTPAQGRCEYILIIPTRVIKKGEALTFDYGRGYPLPDQVRTILAVNVVDRLPQGSAAMGH